MAAVYQTSTGVMMSAPAPEPWSSDLCSCADDTHSCCLSWWCPCVQYAYNSQVVDQSSFCGACCEYVCCGLVGCDMCLRGSLRRRLRYAYNIENSCCCDCAVHWLCGCCALAQETREIAKRGPPKRQQMLVQQAPVILVNGGGPHVVMVQQPQVAYMPQPVAIYKQTSGGQPQQQGMEMGGYQQQQQQYPPPQYSQQQYGAVPSSPPPQYQHSDANAAAMSAQPVAFNYSEPLKPSYAANSDDHNTSGEGQTLR